MTTIAVDVSREESWFPVRRCWEKADWERFNEICEAQIEHITIGENVNEAAKAISDMLLAGDGGYIKKIVPWWTQECYEAIQTRNRAFRVLRRTLTPEEVLEYQRARAIARRTIKAAKRKCWREY